MKKILIVDDHTLFREGLVKMINHWDDFKVVGEASNGVQAIQSVENLSPDIVLMDIAMPLMNGLDALETIARTHPSMIVIMLTASEEEKDLFQAIKTGAKGYVLKNLTSDRLHELLRGAMHGEVALSRSMAAKIWNEFHKLEDSTGQPLEGKYEQLTQREIQILKLIVDGVTNQGIASELGFSTNTVKKYLSTILSKLQLNSRVELAVYAVRHGLADES
jgi:two-component system, NarL family, nitrate/nitrite response regulator NarL